MRLTSATRWLSTMLVVDALIAWTAIELTTSNDGLPALLITMAAPLGITWWQTYRTPEMRREHELTARALADHRDPGPEHRAAVDRRAQAHAPRSRVEEWLPAALLLIPAAACAVLAGVRGDVTAAPPAVALTLAAFGLRAMIRRRQRAASRWLDDPPYEEEQA